MLLISAVELVRLLAAAFLWSTQTEEVPGQAALNPNGSSISIITRNAVLGDERSYQTPCEQVLVLKQSGSRRVTSF